MQQNRTERMQERLYENRLCVCVFPYSFELRKRVKTVPPQKKVRVREQFKLGGLKVSRVWSTNLCLFWNRIEILFWPQIF